MSNGNNSAKGNGSLLITVFLVLAVLGVAVFAYRSLTGGEEAAQTEQVQQDLNVAPSEEARIEALPAEPAAATGDQSGVPQLNGQENGETVPQPAVQGKKDGDLSGTPPPSGN